MKVLRAGKYTPPFGWCDACGEYFTLDHLHFDQSERKLIRVSGKSLYEKGYDDGFQGKPAQMTDALYDMGWEDGYADFQAGVENPNYRPVDPDYALMHEAPEGFEWAGEKRTPGPGDIYLTKNGNPKFQKTVRKNNQTRHLLRIRGDWTCQCHYGPYYKKNCTVHKWDK